MVPNDQQDTAHSPAERSGSRRVFLAAGRDPKMAGDVEGFLRDRQIEIVRTRRGAQGDKPMAQKVMENPDVSAAIVVLSADDFVYPREGKPAEALMRVEQEVVFELGFWLAKFGRQRVAAIYYDQKRFRCPTEFFDVFYIPYNKQSLWRQELDGRLRQWGLCDE